MKNSLKINEQKFGSVMSRDYLCFLFSSYLALTRHSELHTNLKLKQNDH